MTHAALQSSAATHRNHLRYIHKRPTVIPDRVGAVGQMLGGGGGGGGAHLSFAGGQQGEVPLVHSRCAGHVSSRHVAQ